MSSFAVHVARAQYLDCLLARYGTLTLPIASTTYRFSLPTVFQPLALRLDPLSIKEKVDEEQQEKAIQVTTVANGTEALNNSKQRHMVILGGPGMGKTTVLKDLLGQAIRQAQADEAAPLPIFISLPDLARSALSLQSYLASILAELQVDERYAAVLFTAIAEGRAFLCLDSLDEVVPALRPDIIALINRMVTQYGGTWIIGSRFTEYKGGQFAHGSFSEWELLPLDNTARLALAHHLLPALFSLLHPEQTSSELLSQPSADTFIELLQSDIQTTSWGENPLLLSLAATVYVRSGTLPASRALLYHEAISTMLSARTNQAEQLLPLQDLLADIALRLYQTRGRNFTISELQAQLTILYGEKPASEQYQLLSRILDSGVLDIVAYQTYGFRHQMFQEYLAARSLARQLCSANEQERLHAWEFAWRKRTFSRWTEILCLLVGILANEYGAEGTEVAQRWLYALANERKTPEGDIGHLCFLLALSSLREVSIAQQESDLLELARELMMNWAELVQNALDKTRHPLLQRLEHLTNNIRALSIHVVIPALAMLERTAHFNQRNAINRGDGRYEFVEKVVEELWGNINTEVLRIAFRDTRGMSIYAYQTLDSLENYIAVEQLIALIQDRDASRLQREDAIRLLGRMGKHVPIDNLIDLLQDQQTHFSLRKAIIHLLGTLEPSRVVKPLQLAVAQDNNANVRIAAIKMLGNMGIHAPIEMLYMLLHDGDKQIARIAGTALHELHVYLNPAQLDILLHHEESDIRLSGMEVLIYMGEHAPLNLWYDLLNDESIHVRRQAAITLAEMDRRIPREKLIDILLNALDNSDGYRAMQALEKIYTDTPDLTVEPILAACRNGSASNDHYKLLHMLNIHVPVEELLALVKKGYWICGEMLAELGADAPIGQLLEMLAESNPTTSRAAANTLDLLYPHVPTDKIIALLHKETTSSSLLLLIIPILKRYGVQIPRNILLALLQGCKKHSDVTLLRELEQDFVDLGAMAPIEELLAILIERDDYLHDRDKKFLMQIGHLLSMLDTWVTPERILAASAAPNAKDQCVAVDILAALKDFSPDVLKPIMSILEDPQREQEVRGQILFALDEIGEIIPLPYLLMGLDQCYHGMIEMTVEIMIKLGEQAPIQELMALLNDNNNWTRQSVTSSLCALAQYVPIAPLIDAVLHGRPRVRKGAITILGYCGERAPIPLLIELARDKAEDFYIRQAACMTLVPLGERVPSAVSIELLTSLAHDKDNDLEIRGTACTTLVLLGKRVPLEVLIETLYGEQGLPHKNALYVLRQRSKDVTLDELPRLLELLVADIALRHRLIGIITTFGEHVPITLIMSLIEHKGLYERKSFDDAEDPLATLVGFQMLCQYIPPHQLITTLSTEELYINEIDTLAVISKYTSFAALLADLDKIEEEREYIVTLLGNLGEYTPLDALLSLLDDRDTDVQSNALIALCEIAERMPAKIIAKTSTDKRRAARIVYLTALAYADEDIPDAGIALAKEFLIDDEQLYYLSQKALERLVDRVLKSSKQSSSKISLAFLLQALQHDGPRWIVLKALEHFGTDMPLDALLPLFGDHDSSIYKAAARTVAQTHPMAIQSVILPQIEAIARVEPTGALFAAHVQRRIAYRISWIERVTPPLMAMLVELLDYPYWDVQLEAIRALGRIRRNIPDRALFRLIELRSDPRSRAIREAADDALAEILMLEGGIEHA